MFANGAAQLVGWASSDGQELYAMMMAIWRTGAWVTLVDLSDEILCLPVSVCVSGWLGGMATGRFVLAPGEACASQVNFQITTGTPAVELGGGETGAKYPG